MKNNKTTETPFNKNVATWTRLRIVGREICNYPLYHLLISINHRQKYLGLINNFLINVPYLTPYEKFCCYKYFKKRFKIRIKEKQKELIWK
jgi:hypothetical protein